MREGSRNRPYFRDLRRVIEDRPPIPEWLQLDGSDLKGTVLRKPERSDIDLTINEQLIVEYYSR